MKLDRNLNSDGRGKYALINLRNNKVEWGNKGNEDEFFVIKLRDKHAYAALIAYSSSVNSYDPEFASEVRELALRAGKNNPYCKEPD